MRILIDKILKHLYMLQESLILCKHGYIYWSLILKGKNQTFLLYTFCRNTYPKGEHLWKCTELSLKRKEWIGFPRFLITACDVDCAVTDLSRKWRCRIVLSWRMLVTRDATERGRSSAVNVNTFNKPWNCWSWNIVLSSYHSPCNSTG